MSQDGDGDHGKQGDQQPVKRSAFRALVQDFTPLWYGPQRAQYHISDIKLTRTGSRGA